MLFRLLKNLFDKREDGKRENGDVVKPFLDHLEDLRWTIIKMAVVLFVMVVVCFVFAHERSRLSSSPLPPSFPDESRTRLNMKEEKKTLKDSAHVLTVCVGMPILQVMRHK